MMAPLSKWGRPLFVWLAAALLAISGLGLWQSVLAAGEQSSSDIAYAHRGAFGYDVYVEPGILYSEEFELPDDEVADENDKPATARIDSTDEPPMVLFRDIMEELLLSFTYEFECGEPAVVESSDVVVTIVAENPGLWHKEMWRWEETHTGEEFRVDFPFEIDTLEADVDEIEEEIGIARLPKDFIVTAIVHTAGETRDGDTIEVEFTHTLRAILDDKKLELEGELERTTGGGSDDDVSWTCSGRFDYEAQLEYNALYESIVLRTESLPTAEVEPTIEPVEPKVVVRLPPGATYFPSLVDTIEARFSYVLECDRPVTVESETVRITAVLAKADTWSKELLLMPETRKSGPFTLSFPIDIHYFDEVVGAIEEQIEDRGGSYSIEIRAEVETMVETREGTIDDIYAQTLQGTREGNTLTFQKELSGSQEGVIEVEVESANPGPGRWKILSIAGVCVGGLALAFLGVVRVRSSRRDAVAATVPHLISRNLVVARRLAVVVVAEDQVKRFRVPGHPNVGAVAVAVGPGGGGGRHQPFLGPVLKFAVDGHRFGRLGRRPFA
ncbi:MAG: hypothetical protein E4G93_05415, partial [Dehalococcoidia bacterium]